MNPFPDRREAGRQLALRLAEYANRPDVTILAVLRGGVPVAFEVARVLDAPLDLLVINDGSAPELSGQTVIVIADGIVTGVSMRVAVATLRARGAARVIVAAPVVAPNAFAELATVADACVTVATPESFDAISAGYSDATPVTDAIALFFLERAALAESKHLVERVRGLDSSVILSRQAKDPHSPDRGRSIGMTKILHLPAVGGHQARDDKRYPNL